MALDAAVNFSKSNVSTGYAAGVTSITLVTGGATRFSITPPFNAVWWNSTDYADPADDPGVEVVRVTNIATDTYTIARAQEGTANANHNLAGKTYTLIAGPTAKLITDLGTTFAAKATTLAGYGITDALGLHATADTATSAVTATTATSATTATTATSATTAGDGLSSAAGTAPLTLSLSAKALAGSVAITPANPGGAVALQASAPGTAQTGNANLSGTIEAASIKLTAGANIGYVLTSDAVGLGSWISPSSGMIYRGAWDATANVPTLADGTGTTGDIWAVSVGGTQFTRVFVAGGSAMYNGSIWQPIGTSTAVTSVNGSTGAVSLVLASAQFANQGTTTTLLHGDAAGNPAFGQAVLTADVTGILPVANGGTNAGLFTLGSIVFVGASGTYSEDNANAFWDDTAKALLVKNIGLPATSNSTTGVVFKGADSFIHNYAAAGSTGFNTFVGVAAGNFTMGPGGGAANLGSGNSATGYQALYSNTTGFYNSATGLGALAANTTGHDNSALGVLALYSNTTGFYNSVIGVNTLYSNTTGSYCSVLGVSALYDLNITDGTGANTAVGYNTGRGITTGINNTILGANVTGLAAALSNNIIIADGAGNQRINVDANGLVSVGAMATKTGTVAVTNGLNSNIVPPAFSYVRLTGPTLAFSVGGFTLPANGRKLTIYNTTAQVMTVVNEDASSTAANRIKTLTGGNVIVGPGMEAASFVYDVTDSRWILTACAPGLPGSVTTLAVANGLNSNVVTPGSSYVRLTTPTTAFSLGGFTLPYDGRRLTVYNTTAYQMTLVNEDVSSTAVNRIKTLTGANVVLAGTTVTANFVYDATDSRWIYVAPPLPAVAGSAVTSVATALALTSAHCFVRVDASGAARTITLPTATAAGVGKIYYVKKTDSSANAVVIATSGGNTLDGVTGATAFSIYTQYQSIGIISPDTGADWSIF